MRVVVFCHSIISDWNHGNAHFLRGVGSELLARGHDVTFYEPRDAWSLTNLVADHGVQAVDAFHHAYPAIVAHRYDPARLDLDAMLHGANLVLVHEWNSHELVAAIGAHRARTRSYRLFFHDTHHRAITDPAAMRAYDLRDYDGVLAFGAVLRDVYVRRGWAREVWAWHEAADTRVFRPIPEVAKAGDLIWVGNWGDDERTIELNEFLLKPVTALQLRAKIFGVRYPEAALEALRSAGIEYGGWLANYRVPEQFARYRVTVHVPRRPYAAALHGIPTIRPFEAMACGIPMVSAPWNDDEDLFTAGSDYLQVRNADQMRSTIRELLCDPSFAQQIAEHGRRTILDRHTCSHRVDELMAIYHGVASDTSAKEIAL